MKRVQLIEFARSKLHLSGTPAQIPGSQMWAIEAEITPKMAADWLATFNDKNRKLRESTAKRYAADMAAKRWHVTHQGIAFDQNQRLTSGQHRLHGCVISKMPLRSLVVLNCSTKERACIDQTLGRNVRDVAELVHSDSVSGRLISVARAMAYGRNLRAPVQMTNQQVYEFIEQHRKALDVVLSAVTRNVRGVTTATVLAPIARAATTHPAGKIKAFCGLLIDGLASKKGDRPAILLRNRLLENAGNLNGTEGRQRAYGLTEFALSSYLNGEEIDRLSEADKELFPLKTAGLTPLTA